MLQYMCPLMGGNLLIALLEAWVLHALFKPGGRFIRSFGILLLGNYVSAVVGLLIFPWGSRLLFGDLFGDQSLYYVGLIAIGVLSFAWAITLAVEGPFCAWVLGKGRSGGRAFKATVVSQTVSYAVLMLPVAAAGGLSLVTQWHRSPAVVSQASNVATVYFLSDGLLRSVRLNGTDLKHVCPLPPQAGHFTRLYLRRRRGQPDWDLIAVAGQDELVLVPRLCRSGAVACLSHHSREQEEFEGRPWHVPEPPAGLVGVPDPDWQILFLPATFRGISGSHKRTGQTLHLDFSLPFNEWVSTCPSLLPDDLLVCQLEDQIVLLDLNSGRIGIIARGTDPVVVLDEDYARRFVLPATASVPVQ